MIPRKSPKTLWYDSIPDKKLQLPFSNIIIQYVPYAWLNGGWVAQADLAGKGKATIFTHGRVVEGSSQSDGHIRFLDENGPEILLASGKTFVARMPSEGGKVAWKGTKKVRKPLIDKGLRFFEIFLQKSFKKVLTKGLNGDNIYKLAREHST